MANVRRLAPEAKVQSSAVDPLGRHALFSPQPSQERGAVVMECSACGGRSRMTVTRAIRAHAPFFLWLPLLQNSRWMSCPLCGQRAWARVRLRS